MIGAIQTVDIDANTATEIGRICQAIEFIDNDKIRLVVKSKLHSLVDDMLVKLYNNKVNEVQSMLSNLQDTIGFTVEEYELINK